MGNVVKRNRHSSNQYAHSKRNGKKWFHGIPLHAFKTEIQIKKIEHFHYKNNMYIVYI